MQDIEWEVSSNEVDGARLGGEFGEYVILMRVARELGLLSETAERLRLSRRHGFAGLDIVMFLLAWLVYPEKLGVRAFSGRCVRHGAWLAALGDRARWASQASVSRALATCETEQVQALSHWLLGEALPVLPLESDMSVASRCAFGESWHIFDYDPTVRVIRERALPEGDDLPPARRRASAMGEPGYPGRKRGERQVSRAALMHAGTGQWVGMWMHPGNGRSRQTLSEAAALAAGWCSRRSLPPDRVVLRFDGGASPGVPGVTSCREAGVHWLTRASTHVLEEPEVQQRLATATWRAVADSKSGPRREAAELGTLRMRPSGPTRRSDGSRFAAVETRVVISRFAAVEEVAGAGLTRDGWHYEVFATSLPPGHWPAADVVTAYYERSVLENRFAQEDRELHLDRLASCHLPGQQLAVLVGMFVWNLRLWLGARMEGLPPGRTGPQELRPAEELAAPTPPTSIDEASAGPEPPEPPSPRTEVTAYPGSSTLELRAWLSPLLPELDWKALLARRRDGWRWDQQAVELICPQDLPLVLYHVRPARKRLALDASFRMRERACPTCPVRDSCIRGRDDKRIRAFDFTLDGDDHPLIGPLLARLFEDGHVVFPHAKPMPPPPPSRWRPPVPAVPGPYRCAPPTLVPARLRTRVRDLARAETHLTLDAETITRSPDAFALTPAQRQRRRWTWQQRHDYNVRRGATPLRVRLDAPLASAPLLQAVMQVVDMRKSAG